MNEEMILYVRGNGRMKNKFIQAKSSALHRGVILLMGLINFVLLIQILVPQGHYALSHVAKPHAAFIVQNEDVVPVNSSKIVSEGTASNANEFTVQNNNYTVILDWKLAETRKDGGYTVETYREFEIYKGPQNQTVKTIPTNHFKYLRYWTYE
jgi:hypothetical protein